MERRREKRQNSAGDLRLVIEAPQRAEVTGQLVDVSAGGFRALHACAALSAGQEVNFDYAAAHGKARVMWTRVVGAQVESGFLVI